jgi:diguanylate cyclase (GGDEF)-like protein/PAS domain S-box-containing protein
MTSLFNRIFARARDGAGTPIDKSFQLLAENSLDVILRVGPDLRTRYASPSSADIFGWTPREMLGKGLTDTIPADDLPEVATMIARLLSGTVDTAAVTTRIRRKDGSAIWVEANGKVIRDRTDALGDLIVVIRPISERETFEDRPLESSLTDGATGLVNRRGFDETLDREWRRMTRFSGEISLLLVEIDGYRDLFARYGQKVADICLRQLAAAIRKSVHRGGDLAARFGEDAFAILLPGTDGEGAVHVAQNIQTEVGKLRLSHPGNPEGGSPVAVRIGVATTTVRFGSVIAIPQRLVAAAKEALQNAKKEGGSRIATTFFFDRDDAPGIAAA